VSLRSRTEVENDCDVAPGGGWLTLVTIQKIAGGKPAESLRAWTTVASFRLQLAPFLLLFR